ncbi:MAG TPA: NUDIX domain-containing protein [Pyrinomonadaceae bacterium]|nr:NUDIX domain-containing protein [Pyrinomonadaceae bacterium]
MLKNLLAKVWRRTPKKVRRWTVGLTQSRFAVTAAGVVTDDHGRVLLLKHVFRPGSGWGLPGGFLGAGEQAETALARELSEEVGLELESAQLFTTRVFKRPRQLEIVFRCKTTGEALPQSIEVSESEWFAPDSLPAGLPQDQRDLIRQALAEGTRSERGG